MTDWEAQLELEFKRGIPEYPGPVCGIAGGYTYEGHAAGMENTVNQFISFCHNQCSCEKR